MKRLTLELARTGVHGEAGVRVTESMLRELVDTFTGRVPIALGHELADWMPAVGYVVDVGLNANVLTGTVELTDALASAYDEGSYRNWSIGTRRRGSDGKLYLHHLAMLGATPPAIKDLNVLAASDAASEAVRTDTCVDHWRVSPVRLADAQPEAPEGSADGEPPADDADADPPPAPEPKDAPPDAAQAATDQPTDAPTEEEAAMPEDVTLSEQAQTLERLERAERRLRDGAIRALNAALDGRVPQDRRPLVMALADRLPVDDEIELADGDATRTVSSIDLLREAIESIPMPVTPGEMDFSDATDTSAVDYASLTACM